MDFDTLIIGAGAAGLICAAQAPGKCVVIDHAKAAGEKIRISGGGRCNFTNLYASAENYISRNPHFAKSALARYTQWDFIDWVTRSGIAYHEKTLGQLFCDTSAKEIITMLLKGVADAGGQVQLNTSVQSVSPIEGGYAIQMSGPHGPRSVTARHLVVACGGKPIPKMGATDFALRLAQQFGIPVTHTYAGLVPFTFSGAQQEAFQTISGVAAPARLQTNGTTFEEAVLFTHRGLSGPAALQVSSYWAPGDATHVGSVVRSGAAPSCAERQRNRRAEISADRPHPPSASAVGVFGAARSRLTRAHRRSHRRATGPSDRAPHQMAAYSRRHRRLSHRRSDGRRSGYSCPLVQNDDGKNSTRSVFHRRMCRCHRLAWRV